MNYPDFVRSRFKSGELIAEEMTPHKAALLSMICAHLVDSANSLDHVKKYAIYNKENLAASTPVSLDDQRLYRKAISPAQCELLHAAIGLVGEAGELLDTVCKHVFAWQPLDEHNVIEELGDLCFYLQAACQSIATKREDIEGLNMAKLTQRYKEGYSDKQAKDRADKAGAE